jgi:hypothetical protein
VLRAVLQYSDLNELMAGEAGGAPAKRAHVWVTLTTLPLSVTGDHGKGPIREIGGSGGQARGAVSPELESRPTAVVTADVSTPSSSGDRG